MTPQGGTVGGAPAVAGVRPGMTDVIQQLRVLASAGTAQFTVRATQYYADIHLQTHLDQTRDDIIMAPVSWQRQINPATGVPVYTIGYISDGHGGMIGNLEATAGTVFSDPFVVTDTMGSALPVADYTVDYTRGLVIFTSDQAGSARYINARTYDLNRSAAQVWREKASYAARGFDFKVDNQWISGNQIYQHCVEMAEYYETLSTLGRGGAAYLNVIRDDLL